MFLGLNKVLIFVSNNIKQMENYKRKYCLTYWAERNDEATDIELIVYAYNEIEARKQFLDMNITHKKIESIKIAVT